MRKAIHGLEPTTNRILMKNHRLALAAAFAGLLASAPLRAETPAETTPAKPGTEKHGCSGKSGCSAKDKSSCAGKSGCGAKDKPTDKEKSSCSAKEGCSGKDKPADKEKSACAGKDGCGAKDKPKQST